MAPSFRKETTNMSTIELANEDNSPAEVIASARHKESESPSNTLKGISPMNLQGVWDVPWYETVCQIVDASPKGKVNFKLFDGRRGLVKRDADGNLQAYVGGAPCSPLRALTTGRPVAGEPELLEVSAVLVEGRTRRPGPHDVIRYLPHASTLPTAACA